MKLINKVISLVFCVSAQLLLLPAPSYAQKSKLILRGAIQSVNGDSIRNSSISIIKKTNQSIIYFGFTGNKNNFSLSLPFTGSDSLYLKFSHTGYRDTVKKIFVSPPYDSVDIRVTLAINEAMLEEVVVGPKTWRKGDTTFFKIDAYKDGEERKLKDIMIKLPGFSLNTEGNLEYKKRTVDKITINGEDIFADKTSLLLNNFPVHVLDTIQALENQSDNKLMKGLVNEGKIFINLALKKDKLKAAFGDLEGGIGTSHRYLVTSTFFTLTGKLKMGAILNYNNISNGVGTSEEAEVKNAPVIRDEKWLLKNNFLYTIQNFESRNFVKNRLYDNRLKINLVHTNKLKSEIEINFLKDRQIQNVFKSVVLINDSTFFERQEYINNERTPKLLLIKENTTLNISKTKQTEFNFSAYADHSGGIQNTVYFQNLSTTLAENILGNNSKAYTAKLQFINRLTADKAITVYAQYSKGKSIQNNFVISQGLDIIFNQNDDRYNKSNLTLNVRSNTTDIGIEYLTKVKGKLISTNISFQSYTTAVSTNMFLSSSFLNLPGKPVSILNHTGEYSNRYLSGKTVKTITVFNKPVFLTVRYGLCNYLLKESSDRKNSTVPLYSFQINQKTKYNKNIDANFDISYSSNSVEQVQLSGIILPTSFNSYKRGNFTDESVKKIQMNYGLGFDFLKHRHFIYLNAGYINNLSGYIPSYSYINFILISSDTFIKRSTQAASLSFNYKPPSFLKSEISFNGAVSSSRIIFKQSSGIQYGNSFFHVWRFNAKRKFDKKYLLFIEGEYTGYKFHFPDNLKNGIPASKASKFLLGLKQTFFIREKTNVFINVETYRNFLFQNKQFFIAETGGSFYIPKLPLGFSVKIQNLLNTKQFNTYKVSGFYRSMDEIAIFKRLLFVTARYEL